VDLIIEPIWFLWNIIFTSYYTRVRPQCDYTILGRPFNGNFDEILEIKWNFGTKKRSLLQGAFWKLSVSRISKILVLFNCFYLRGSQYVIINVCSLGTQSRSRRAPKKKEFSSCSIPVRVTRFYSREQIERAQAMDNLEK